MKIREKLAYTFLGFGIGALGAVVYEEHITTPIEYASRINENNQKEMVVINRRGNVISVKPMFDMESFLKKPYDANELEKIKKNKESKTKKKLVNCI